MKRTLALLLLVLLWQFIPASAQKSIALRNGIVTVTNNINDRFIDDYNRTATKTDGKSWVLLQFNTNPSAATRKSLQQGGIELLQYIPHNVFMVAITQPLTTRILKNAGVSAIVELSPEQKTDPRLLHSPDSLSSREVMVLFHQAASFETVSALLQQQGFTITNTTNKYYNVIQVIVPPRRLLQLAQLPFIEYIEEMAPPATPLLINSRNDARANILNSGLPGGYHLTGEGVTVGIGEVGYLQTHVDYRDRLAGDHVRDLSHGSGDYYHSTHVHGIIGGAGLVNELYSGFAPKSTLIPLFSTEALSQSTIAPLLGYGMVLSNNSYVNGNSCSRQGYSIFQFLADKQALDFDVVQHVFGAGNSATDVCSGYPAGFATILTNYHSAKSILSVGATFANGDIGPFSSRGPAGDGRIKPEIVAMGTYVISTVPNDQYGFNTGTSMSSPAVTGGLALLYQRYRQLHNGANPKNSLMKAVICNTATDLGNKGPDYIFGFGFMNLLRAVKVLDQSSYIMDSIPNQSTKTHKITIPAGTAQLKIMLYWQDPAASPQSPRALVNDLDLQVTTPAAATVLPYILDTLPSHVGNPATRGEDHINNIEQAVIDDPVAGSYTINVKGTDIQQNPLQPYVVVYDIVPDEVQLTFPNGGENLDPGESMAVQWDSWGHRSSSFTLQYSPDNGATWQPIATTIDANARLYTWQVPAGATNQARVRLVRNEDGKTSTSQSFVILGIPVMGLDTEQCPEQIGLHWFSVTGATDYELMMIKNGEMVNVAYTTGNNYIFKNLVRDSTYWITVRARIGQSHGRRAVAVWRKPDTGSCAGNLSDKDVKADSLIAPLFGRKFTSQTLGTAETIRFRIRNLDDAPVSGFTVSYSVNSGTWTNETPGVTIPALGQLDYNFATPYNFSALGNYEIRLAVKMPGDNNTGNDTLTYLIRHLNNPVVDLSTPVVDNFEQSPLQTYVASKWGLNGTDKFDFQKESGDGWLAVIAKAVSDTSGNGLRLSQSFTGQHSLIATYNLSNYDTTANDISLDFNCLLYGSGVYYTDTLWVRGNDAAPWIKVKPLFPEAGTITKILGASELADYLRGAQQNFSSSFQLRWSQSASATSYGFDNIRLYDVSKDIDLLSIDSLNVKFCALSNPVPVRITIRNRSKLPVTNVLVKYRIDNGATVTETISIPGNTTMPFIFTTTANLSGIGFHTIEAWAELPGDTYTFNDRKSVTIRNQPVITSFPYLQNFETGQNNWYAEGTNSSWEYGTPASAAITGAASGSKAWKTKLSGLYNNNENSFVYSPCFDLSLLDHPMLSLSLAANMDSCNICDVASLQFSVNGKDWAQLIDPVRAGYNLPRIIRAKKYTRWHVGTTTLPDSVSVVQFRMNFRSDFAIAYEGMAFDDVNVYDSLSSIYDGPANSNVLEQTITGGNSWIDFKDNTKIIAAIQPGNQQLGITTVQAFLQNNNPNFHGQYYLRRGFAIKTQYPLTDSVGVRLYFLDKESDSLLFAKSCPSCLRAANAYRFGVSQYSSSKETEINSSLSDNIKGDWSFINPAAVKTVPWQKGYYLEFKTKNLSELWLNNGGYQNNSYLPTELLHFTVALAPGNKALLQWQTAAEINIQRFEIEAAKGNEAYQQDTYSLLGQVATGGASPAPQSYEYTDASDGKKGVYYYRIKIIDQYGNYSYSKIQPLAYDNNFKWSVTPTVSNGLFSLNYQLNTGDMARIKLFNGAGALVKEEQVTGNGFIGQHVIDLANPSYASGLYLARVYFNNQVRAFKIIKH